LYCVLFIKSIQKISILEKAKTLGVSAFCFCFVA
jgi:hypothetical protein